MTDHTISPLSYNTQYFTRQGNYQISETRPARHRLDILMRSEREEGFHIITLISIFPSCEIQTWPSMIHWGQWKWTGGGRCHSLEDDPSKKQMSIFWPNANLQRNKLISIIKQSYQDHNSLLQNLKQLNQNLTVKPKQNSKSASSEAKHNQFQ